MAYVSVDIDLDDVLNNLSTRELEELANALIEDGYGPEEAALPESQEPTTLNLDDPVIRLDAIVELRRLGYSVEPTTGVAR